jgi:hypothetical protein
MGEEPYLYDLSVALRSGLVESSFVAQVRPVDSTRREQKSYALDVAAVRSIVQRRVALLGIRHVNARLGFQLAR